MMMRGLDLFGFPDGGAGIGSSAVGGGGGVGGASVVIGRRREQYGAVGAAVLAGTGLEQTDETQLGGATRGQMLANSRADCAVKSHVCARRGLPSPAGHPALTLPGPGSAP